MATNFIISRTKKKFSVLNVRIDGFPLATTSVWVNAGSMKDPLDKLGLSHFFEHLLFTSTKEYPNRQIRLEEIEKNGLLFNAFTSLQYQHYFYVHDPKKSKKALDLLIDGLCFSNFTEQDIDREKQIILSEEKENHNNPGSYIWRIANSGLWNKNKLGKDFFGSKHTINAIQKSDINSFYRNYFNQNNILFVFINSELSINEQSEKIDAYVTDLGNKNEDKVISEHYTKVSAPIIYEKAEIDGVEIAFSFLTHDIFKTKEKATQDLISGYLASGWISRLVQKLRIENNLTYWVNQDSFNGEETGYIRFTLSTEPENVPKIIKIIEREVSLLHNVPIPPDVLRNHKTKLLSDIVRSSTEYTWLMQWYGYNCLLKNKNLDLNEYKKQLTSVTPENIVSYSRKYLISDRFSLAIIAREKPELPTLIFQ